MITLQNEHPSLESVSEHEDQYKNYGKSIRRLIVECLQKDPAKRPTASELLKHPFIKKAKDRRYLLQTLLPNTPSFAERSKRALEAKRCSGFDSGNDGGSGSWVWPQEDGCPGGQPQQNGGGQNATFINADNGNLPDMVGPEDDVNRVVEFSGNNIDQQQAHEQQCIALNERDGLSQSSGGSSVISSNTTDGLASSVKSTELYEECSDVYAIDDCDGTLAERIQQPELKQLEQQQGEQNQQQQQQTDQQEQTAQQEQIQRMPPQPANTATTKMVTFNSKQLQRSRSCDDSSNNSNLRSTSESYAFT